MIGAGLSKHEAEVCSQSFYTASYGGLAEQNIGLDDVDSIPQGTSKV